jgi:signal transduction histidine kinase
MAAQVAHEINNPLAGIKNSFRLIRDAVPVDHPDHDMVGRIEREIDRIAHVVRQMYTLHTARPHLPTCVLVPETVRDVVAMLEPLCRAHDVDIELAPVSPDLTVWAPEGSLHQVLYNLTTNALKASPRGGVIQIRAELTEDRFAKFTVRDQGPGIAAEVEKRMFEPFFSAGTGGNMSEGLGLGLSIVKRIVDSLRGRIEFDCAAGQGTTFRVYLPTQQT